MIDALVRGTSNAILGQEAQGQRSFVNSETLPTDNRGAKAILETFGVKFLGIVESDPMFQYVELPEGWKKVATDHSMWSDLVDEQGRKRASIFYKAAFYDRSAHMSLNRRYNYNRDYTRQNDEGVAVAFVTDGKAVIYTTPVYQLPSERTKEFYVLTDRVDEEAKEWLDTHYPDWQNSGAYW
mgnify:CR=1 FL=1